MGVKSLHIDQAMCHFEEIRSRVRSLNQNSQNKQSLKLMIIEIFNLVASCRERIRHYQAEAN